MGQLIIGLTAAWAFQPHPALDLSRWAAPREEVPGPAQLCLLPMAALQKGAWWGQKWPFLAASLKSTAGPDDQQGLGSSDLGFIFTLDEVIGIGAQRCSRKNEGRQTAADHNGTLSRPGILFFCPCLKSWRQLGFLGHLEVHLWGIYEGWLISSSY